MFMIIIIRILHKLPSVTLELVDCFAFLHIKEKYRALRTA